jgi:formamidopyrimidine-DNA glycosylase
MKIEVGARRARMKVRSTYRLRGVAGRFGGERTLVAVKTSRGWRVARETRSRGRHPWEIGRFVRTRSRHFTVLAPAGLELAGLSTALEAGRDALGRVLDTGPAVRRSLVLVAGSASDARRMTSGIRGVESLAAITDSQVRESGAARRAAKVVAQRVLVVWPVFRELDPAGRARIVTHELTHAALAGQTSGRTPAWLVEGMALYTSRDRRVGEAARALARTPDAVLSLSDSRGRTGSPGSPGRASARPTRTPRPRPTTSSSATARTGSSSSTGRTTARRSAARPGIRGRATAPSGPRSGCRSPGWTGTCARGRAPTPEGPEAGRHTPGAMPELPEVETIRRHLAPHVEGRRLTALRISDPRWSLPLAPGALASAVEGRRVEALSRRGKYLIWDLEDDVHLLVHLRMTGTLLLGDDADYARVTFELDDGAQRLVFSDPRRFGTGELAVGPEALGAFLGARLGLEPFDPAFTARHLRALARASRAPVKAFLLDQRKIAGVGNIYADEALHRAGIHPERPANRLKPAQVAALRDAVVASLADGIACQGGDDRRLPPPRRRPRGLPGRVPRAPARGRAVPRVRDARAQARGRRAGDLRLRALPTETSALVPVGVEVFARPHFAGARPGRVSPGRTSLALVPVGFRPAGLRWRSSR